MSDPEKPQVSPEQESDILYSLLARLDRQALVDIIHPRLTGSERNFVADSIARRILDYLDVEEDPGKDTKLGLP